MNFYKKLIDKLKEITSDPKSENEYFAEFFQFFNSEFDKLNPTERESFLKTMERDRKLKDILNSIE